MSIRHFFNRHQEQFIYAITAVFLLFLAIFYIWGIDAVTTNLSSSFETPPVAPSMAGFNVSQAENLTILKTLL